MHDGQIDAGAVGLSGTTFNVGRGPIVLTDVGCDGTESALRSCAGLSPPPFCRNLQIAGVRCQPGQQIHR